jgi:hypothetical protein
MSQQILCVGHCHAFKQIYGKRGLRNCELACVDQHYGLKKVEDDDPIGDVLELEIELRLGMHKMKNGGENSKSGSWGSFYGECNRNGQKSQTNFDASMNAIVEGKLI